MTGDLAWTVRARCVQDHLPTAYFFANDEHPVTPARADHKKRHVEKKAS